MKLRVDPERCQAHTYCVINAPDLFELLEDGRSHARNDGVVKAEDVPLAELAIRGCPERAIEWVNDDD